MEQYFLKNRRTIINGINFKEEKDIITAVLFNPVDYVIDGMKFINSTKIQNIVSDTDEFKNQIMNKKTERYFDDINKKDIKNSKLQNFQDLFAFVKSKDILCELSLSKEDVSYIGKVINIYEDSIDIDFFSTKCKLVDNAYVEFEDITTVTIFSDYLDTLSEIIRLNNK